ncbi:MAG: right-handed parallel beta-helix repeat-containing protein [Candidatus Omnitrophota bacterium]
MNNKETTYKIMKFAYPKAIFFVLIAFFVFFANPLISAGSDDNESLAVTNLIRLSHPGYAMNNTFYGTKNPLNADQTRILMYELSNTTNSSGNGRANVWGFIDQSECQAHSPTPCLLNWQTEDEYKQAARPLPTIDNTGAHRWKVGTIFWSPLESEKDVLYAIPNAEIYHVYKINVTDDSVTQLASFDPSDGTDVSGTECYGFTDRNTFRCSFKDNDWSTGGFEFDVTNNTILQISPSYFSAVLDPAREFCQAHPGSPLPDEYYGYPHTGSGHNALSQNKQHHAIGYGTRPVGVWHFPTCTFYPDNTRSANYPHELFWYYPSHVTWANEQSGYFFSDSPNSFYGSSQRSGHNTQPWLKTVSLFQIFFDRSTEVFDHHHLISFQTAGKWNELHPETCEAYDETAPCAYNWTYSPLPYVSKDGRRLFFTSSMGKYSYTDHNLKGVTPYGGAGLFMAVLAPASQVDECIDNDKDGFGQNCVLGDDCDDNDHYIHPNASEVYDDRDNNCNDVKDCSEDPNLVCAPRNIYVDKSSMGGACDDGRSRGDSSLATPFCTIQKAADEALPGDSILIRAGTYKEKSLLIDKGGAGPEHRVTFKPYGAESVTIRLGEHYDSGWVNSDNGIYSRDFSGSGFDLTSLKAIGENSYGLLAAANLAELQSAGFAAGQDAFYVETTNNTVYLRLVNLNPENVFFVDRESVIKVQSPFVTFENLNIEYAYQGFRVTLYGVWDDYAEHGHYFTLVNSRVRNTYYEGLYSDRDHVIIARNHFSFAGVPVKWDSGTLEINYDATAVAAKGDYALIENNIIQDTVTSVDYRSDSQPPGYAVRNFIIRNNNLKARVVGSGLDGLFYNNIVYVPDGVAFSLYYETKNNGVYNNVFHSSSGVLLSRYGASEYVDFRNNIILGTNNGRCMDFDQGLIGTFTLDHNVYYNCSKYYRADEEIGGGFSGYKNFMVGYNQEQNSSNINPLLGADTYYPAANSSIIDEGIQLSSFNQDARGVLRPSGEAWDAGVYEMVAGTVCGNAVIEAGEQCDDGNSSGGDGCSAICQVEQGYLPSPICSNSIVETGEQCDDGNLINGDGCSAVCQTEEPLPPVCSNSIIEEGEQCDDGNIIDGDGCSSLCQTEEASPFLTFFVDASLSADCLDNNYDPSTRSCAGSSTGYKGWRSPATALIAIKNLQNNNTIVTGGHTIYFRAGTYRDYLTDVHWPSGVEGKPNKIEGYQNEEVILSGTNIKTVWEDMGNGVYRTVLAGSEDVNRGVFEDGQALYSARFPEDYRTRLASSSSDDGDNDLNDGFTRYGLVDCDLNQLPDEKIIGSWAEIMTEYLWKKKAKIVDYDRDSCEAVFSTSINPIENNFLEINADGTYKNGDPSNDSPYRLVDNLNLLDTPGEYLYQFGALSSDPDYVYVRPLSQEAPQNHTWEVSSRSVVVIFQQNSHHIEFRKFNLRFAGAHGLYVHTTDTPELFPNHLVFDNLHVYNNGSSGVYFYSYNSHLVFENSLVENNGGIGLFYVGPNFGPNDSQYHPVNSQIRNNQFINNISCGTLTYYTKDLVYHDNYYEGNGLFNLNSAASIHDSSDIEFYNNHIVRNGGNGILLEGRPTYRVLRVNIHNNLIEEAAYLSPAWVTGIWLSDTDSSLVENNIFHTPNGVALHVDSGRDNRVIYNQFLDIFDNVPTITYGAVLLENADSDSREITWPYSINNTIAHNIFMGSFKYGLKVYADFEDEEPYGSNVRENTVANNIFYSTSSGKVIPTSLQYDVDHSLNTYNNNIYFAPNASEIKFVYQTLGNQATAEFNFADFQEFSGQENNSAALDPLFTNFNDGDFTLLPGSPAIDNAMLLLDINDLDYRGVGPDIGAIEFASAPLCSNSIVEEGEQCDDGNLADEDGCSSTCEVEPQPIFINPPPGNSEPEPIQGNQSVGQSQVSSDSQVSQRTTESSSVDSSQQAPIGFPDSDRSGSVSSKQNARQDAAFNSRKTVFPDLNIAVPENEQGQSLETAANLLGAKHPRVFGPKNLKIGTGKNTPISWKETASSYSDKANDELKKDSLKGSAAKTPHKTSAVPMSAVAMSIIFLCALAAMVIFLRKSIKK